MSPSNAKTVAAAAATSSVAPPTRAQVILAVALPNACTLGFALAQHWPIATLLWPYWLQLVVHGVFNHLRMRRVANLPVRASSRAYVDPPPPRVPEGQVSKPAFFCIHYGIIVAFVGLFLPDLPVDEGALVLRAALAFVLVARYPPLALGLAAAYLCGVWVPWRPSDETAGILLSGAVFAAVQMYTFVRRRAVDEQLGYGLTDVLLFSPYVRLAPMFVFALVAAFVASDKHAAVELVVGFVVIKSAIEYVGWGLEQRMLKSIGLDEPY